MALKCIQREIRDLEQGSQITNLTIGPAYGDENPYHYQATMFGQAGSPLEDGVYILDIHFSNQHPFSPPKVKFLTKIYHPNIDENGVVYIDILYYTWGPHITIEKLLLSIQSIFTSPDVDASMLGNTEAANLFRQNRAEYDQRVRQWTQKYAM